MDNILTYLDWRGDITLAEREFNLIDNIILCELAYIDFVGVVPRLGNNDSAGITIQDAYEKIKSHSQGIKVTKRSGPLIAYASLLEKLAASQRFGGAWLSHFVDIYDESRHIQFAAMCIGLDDNTTYIVFRGTDSTIIGWRENFAMSFQAIPAQTEAVRYLEDVMLPDGIYRVGGHSKGGNLAAYAAMMVPDELKDQIIAIYNNDGPGFSKEILAEDEYNKIRSKIQRIVPQYCVIGLLFENDTQRHIVKSRTYGILQHDSMSWAVGKDSIVSAEDLHRRSKPINAAISRWLEGLDTAERKALVDHFFDALGSRGAKYLSDIPRSGIGSFSSVFKALVKMETEAKAASGKLRKTVRKGIRESVQGRLKR